MYTYHDKSQFNIKDTISENGTDRLKKERNHHVQRAANIIRGKYTPNYSYARTVFKKKRRKEGNRKAEREKKKKEQDPGLTGLGEKYQLNNPLRGSKRNMVPIFVQTDFVCHE